MQNEPNAEQISLQEKNYLYSSAPKIMSVQENQQTEGQQPFTAKLLAVTPSCMVAVQF